MNNSDLLASLKWIVTFCQEHYEWFGQGKPEDGAEFEWLHTAQSLIAQAESSSIQPPHLLLLMEGGIIHQAIANTPIDYTIIDHDTDGLEEERLCTVDGDQAYCTSHSADVYPETHELLLTQIEQQLKDKTD